MNFVWKAEADIDPSIDFKSHRSSHAQAKNKKKQRETTSANNCQALDIQGLKIINCIHSKVKNTNEQISKS